MNRNKIFLTGKEMLLQSQIYLDLSEIFLTVIVISSDSFFMSNSGTDNVNSCCISIYYRNVCSYVYRV
jgi:hypothetical protein